MKHSRINLSPSDLDSVYLLYSSFSISSLLCSLYPIIYVRSAALEPLDMKKMLITVLVRANTSIGHFLVMESEYMRIRTEDVMCDMIWYI